MTDLVKDIVVVGGGPAGLMAAGKAAMGGATVLLLEKMEKPARKLRITGKGRCNITNVKPMEAFLEEVFPEPRFLRDAFNSFFSDDIISLLNDQGVETVVERGQRVFPKSGKAWDVAEALVNWAKMQGVEIINHAKVEAINHSGGAVQSISFLASKHNKVNTVKCKSIIVATGGMSYPATGSTGDGYALATQCGHALTDLKPALVGFQTEPNYADASGLIVKNVKLSLFAKGKKVCDEFGELELTSYGLSGPIVLKLSRRIIALLAKDSALELELDLKPALNNSKLDARIQREIDDAPRDAVNDLARRLLPKQLAMVMLDFLGIASQKILARLSSSERKAILLWLKEQRFKVIAHRSWDEAIITSGGIPLKEINPKTMESRLIKGLYFAGELIDLDASTGGYNLQVAYSTGWLAGENASLSVQKI